MPLQHAQGLSMNLRTALGLLDEIHWTSLAVKKRDISRYIIQIDVVSTFFMSLICKDQLYSIGDVATEYSAQMVRSYSIMRKAKA